MTTNETNLTQNRWLTARWTFGWLVAVWADHFWMVTMGRVRGFMPRPEFRQARTSQITAYSARSTHFSGFAETSIQGLCVGASVLLGSASFGCAEILTHFPDSGSTWFDCLHRKETHGHIFSNS